VEFTFYYLPFNSLLTEDNLSRLATGRAGFQPAGDKQVAGLPSVPVL